MRRHDEEGREHWEALLKQGIDQLSDLGEEEPPNLAALQMLVADVQAEGRRKLYLDLLKFWAVAAVLLTGAAWALLREPVYFLLLQGVVALLSLVGAGLWYTSRKRVME